MINQVYQLVAPRQINVKFEDISVNTDMLIIRPSYLSICAADQRYYTGKRAQDALNKKLPMALIHEATGKVVYDRKKEYGIGTSVLMIPNTPDQDDGEIAENYLASSKFRASGFDGFMQEYVVMRRDRVIPFDNIAPEVAAVSELVSVAMHSVNTMISHSHKKRNIIGVWGDGNVGYITALLLSKKLKPCKIAVFGVDPYKMGFFSFADYVFHVNQVPEGFAVDHAFECVGGAGSEYAIGQIIDLINPEGTVMLMGVSENDVPINTRIILEKGLKFIGRSRSGREDFIETAEYLQKHPELQERIKKIIRDVVPVSNISDISKAFEEDIKRAFKTVLKWNV